MQLCEKHLKEVFDVRVAALEEEKHSVERSITPNESPDVLGVLMVNTLFTYFNAESNEKTMHLTDESQVNAYNRMILRTVLPSALKKYG